MITPPVIRAALIGCGHISARMARINPVIAGEDAAVVIFTHGGATTLLDGSWASPEEAPRPLGSGGVVLEGRDGSLHFDQSAGELRHITNDGTSVLERYAPPARPIQSAFDNCIAATLAAYESAATGNAVAPESV